MFLTQRQIYLCQQTLRKQSYTPPHSHHKIARLDIYNSRINLLDQDVEDYIEKKEKTKPLEILPEFITTTQCKHKFDDFVKKRRATVEILGVSNLSIVLILKIPININTEEYNIVATQVSKKIVITETENPRTINSNTGTFNNNSPKNKAQKVLLSTSINSYL